MYRFGWLIILCASLVNALIGCANQNSIPSSTLPVATSSSASEQLKAAEKHYTAIFLSNYPMLSTMLQPPTELAGGEYDNRLGDYSPEAFNKFRDNMNEARKVLENILNAGELTDAERQHAKILHNMFSMYAGSPEFTGGFVHFWGGQFPYVIAQNYSPITDVANVMQHQQPVTNLEEAQLYLQRLQAVDEFVDNIIKKYHYDIDQGIILPKKLHSKTLLFFDNFLSASPGEHPLVTTFAERVELISAMDDASKQQVINRAKELLETVVYPAYHRARQAVEESKQLARDDDGLWSQPAGDLAYQFDVKVLGDTDLTPEQVHNLGLSEVTRITGVMDSLLRANGLAEGTVGERMLELSKQSGQLYPDTDAGRSSILAYIDGILSEVMIKSPEIFGSIPEQAVEVRRIPEISEATSAMGYYTPPSLDGSQPGIYWINLRSMDALPKLRIKTLTFHEAVPGHHFQIALNMNQPVGLLRQNSPYNAYSEGWGLYAEYIASEQMGMYEKDDFGNLGRLQAELYRAGRLVVDTGLHYKKWTREQAIEYFMAITGRPLSDVEPEIERYMVMPGQALGYKMGMIALVDLAREAKTALGDNFDIKAFHDVILMPGARSMKMVRQDVADWIAKQSN